MKVIVDTNVLMDALMQREPWNAEAEKIFELAVLNPGCYYITANVLTDIYYMVNKQLHDKQAVKKCMAILLDIFGVLDCLSVDCINAFHSEIRDFEDAIMAAIAGRTGMEYIITRNIKDFKESKVEAIEPKVFLKRLSKAAEEEKIIEGLNTPSSECIPEDEVEW